MVIVLAQNVLAAGLLAATGDLMCQKLECLYRKPPQSLQDSSCLRQSPSSSSSCLHRQRRRPRNASGGEDPMPPDFDEEEAEEEDDEGKRGKGGGSSGLDLDRTRRFMLTSGFLGGFVTYNWYHFLNACLVPGPATAAHVAEKVMLDRVVQAPTMLFCILTLTTAMEPGNRGWERPLRKLRKEFGFAYLAANAYFIPVDVFLFSVVPPELQMVVKMFFAMFYQCALSHLVNRRLK